MRKLLTISLLIVLGVFLCVSCDNDSTRSIEGLYVHNGYTNPCSYRFTGNRVATYKSVGSGLIDIGTFSRNGTTLSVLWDSGKSSTITIGFENSGAGMYINGSWCEKYS